VGTEGKDRTSLGIVGTGAMLVVGGVAVGVLMCGGGFGAAILERLPEIVYAPETVKIPATSHRLPNVTAQRAPDPEPRSPEPSVRSSDPPDRRWDPAPRVFREPARWTEGAEPTPLAPLVVEPVPMPLMPAPLQPAAVVPTPLTPVPEPMAVPSGPMAMVSLTGDAVSVVARPATGPSFRLPGRVPPGTYDVVVTFAGREPFSAGSLLVLDAGPRSVTCRASLGICKIR
jgi:hypothetical protein